MNLRQWHLRQLNDTAEFAEWYRVQREKAVDKKEWPLAMSADEWDEQIAHWRECGRPQ